MASLNKVFLIGRLGQEPEIRTIGTTGTQVVNVSLATSEYSKDKKERTEWHRLSFWNRSAEIVAQYCRKGSQIYVEGSLQTREWTDKEGNKRQNTDIFVNNLQLLDPKPSDSGQREQPRHQPPSQQQHNYSQPQGRFDELPSGPPLADDFGPEDDVPF